MIEKCTNCGSKLVFSPSDKGLKCLSCASVFPIKYEYKFSKKPFSQNIEPKVDTLAGSLKSIKCKNCGANIMLNKQQLQAKCPYCGSTTLTETKNGKLMYIDSLIPFVISKKEAISKFKAALLKKFYANKKVFKKLKEEDVIGVYINAFVFDLDVAASYAGVLSYDYEYKDKDGNSKTVTKYKDVSGVHNKRISNLTIESDSYLTQGEMMQILPFDYGSAVTFEDDFLHGYVMEYKDRLFNDCFNNAEEIVKKIITREILHAYHCDDVVSLTISPSYPKKEYNYCLLPVYFFNSTYKNKHYRVLLNGQTGKFGKFPKDGLRIFLTILFASIIVVGAIFLIWFLM